MTKLAIIRIRGQVRNNPKRHTALNLLGLTKRFATIITEDIPSMRGQIKIITPNITWGEASEETIAMLTKKNPSQKIHNLNPPKKGFARKGTKISYAKKGAYGYRGKDINNMLKKMMV